MGYVKKIAHLQFYMVSLKNMHCFINHDLQYLINFICPIV